MENKHIKDTSHQCHQEMQIKIRYHETTITMAKIQNTDKNKCWWEYKSWWKCNILEDSLTILYKTKHSLCNPAIVLLSIYPNELKMNVHTKNLHMDIYSSFTENCQNLGTTNMSFSWWRWYIQTMEHYTILRRNELSSHEKYMGEA